MTRWRLTVEFTADAPAVARLRHLLTHVWPRAVAAVSVYDIDVAGDPTIEEVTGAGT